jgi:hypothetical protein
MINNFTVRLVETSSQVLLSKCQSNRIRDTLAKRTYISQAKVIFLCSDMAYQFM